jgi:hypothetical protein
MIFLFRVYTKMHKVCVLCKLDFLNDDRRRAANADHPGGTSRQVNSTAVNERTAIIDPHHNRLPSAWIGHSKPRAKGQVAMSCREGKSVKPLTIGRLAPVESVANAIVACDHGRLCQGFAE